MTIFDLVTSQELVAYWENLPQDREPYLFQTLFPDRKQLGMDLSYIKGASGLPAVLKNSAFDVHAIPRERLGFDKFNAEMPYFKESMYIDEKLRQELNKVLQTGNRAYIDPIMNRVFADTAQLLFAASAARERMRAMAITTGAIALASNGQSYSYDYHMPNTHKLSNPNFNDLDYDICEYINESLDIIENDTGVRPTRAICSRNQWNIMKKNNLIAKNIYVLTNGVGTINDNRLREYILDETGVEIVVYAKRFKDEQGNIKPFIPDNLIVFFPTGDLGNTWFGTTPEESDLMSGSSAAVSITDTGVAVTTSKQIDPVNVETKVSMICLISFEMADQVLIVDTTSE